MKAFLGSLICIAICMSVLFAQSAENGGEKKDQYSIKQASIVSGAIIESQNNNFIVSASAGQTAIDSIGNDNFIIYFGFWDNYNLIVGLPQEDFTLPTEFQLKQNYPNPFNPATTIDYAIPQSGDVTIEIYNILGQKISVIVNERQDAGYHSVKWRGVNINGNVAGNGMYYYRIFIKTSDGKTFSKTKKMVFLK